MVDKILRSDLLPLGCFSMALCVGGAVCGEGGEGQSRGCVPVSVDVSPHQCFVVVSS